MWHVQISGQFSHVSPCGCFPSIFRVSMWDSCVFSIHAFFQFESRLLVFFNEHSSVAQDANYCHKHSSDLIFKPELFQKQNVYITLLNGEKFTVKKFKHANTTFITATQERHVVGIRIINRRYQRMNPPCKYFTWLRRRNDLYIQQSKKSGLGMVST